MMLKLIKQYIPKPIKNKLRYVKNIFTNQIYKKYLAKKMQKKHKVLEKELSNKKKIKVVFLAIHQSTWKVDSVFKNMLLDPLFEPIILVCPYVIYDTENMWEEMSLSYNYFKKKGYPVISAFNKEKNKWITLDELNTDIVFFTNPHNLTRKEYYQDAYLNYLSCYVPYHHEVGSYDNDICQYGQPFHASLWRFYACHKSSYLQFKKHNKIHSQIKIFGYPAMSNIINKMQNESYLNVWKQKDSRKRIIWAPHHSIDLEILPYSNFLKYSSLMIDLVEKYKEDVIWSFKPHPILKAKLYLHPAWGKEKTDQYYQYWEEQEFTQLELTEYDNLFCSSDAMIHDSGSFLAEYLYLRKPVLYLISKDNNGSFYNDFGLKSLAACQHGHDIKDIEGFIIDVINGHDISNKHVKFVDNEIMPFFQNYDTPTKKIIRDIKEGLGYAS